MPLLLAAELTGVQVAIAAATAATVVAVAGAALFQAWLSRAWLDVRFNDIDTVHEPYRNKPPRARVAVVIDLGNRSRRDNKIRDIQLHTTQPETRVLDEHNLDFSLEAPLQSLSLGGLPAPLPIPVPTDSALRLYVVLTFWAPHPWFGKHLRGELTLQDVHHKRYRFRVDRNLPDGPIEPEHGAGSGIEHSTLKGVAPLPLYPR